MSTTRTAPSFVVGIGASAGGLQAVRALLADIAPDAATAFVLVMHLDPDRPSRMAELLQRSTSLSVVEVRERMPLAADHLYVLAPGRRVTLDGATTLELDAIEGHPATEMLIDLLFGSLAAACGARCAGIALSGGGRDGAAGLRRIMAAGGLALVQEPREAEFDTMPLAALEATAPTAARTVDAMASLLADFVAGDDPGPTPAEPPVRENPRSPGPGGDDGVPRLSRLLSDATGVDFGLYKDGTLRRRAERRMLLHGSDWNAYLERLDDDVEELEALYADVLIGVTAFFRDPEAWASLEAELPGLIAARGGAEVRAWVAGCASGEEAYSLAILLDEQLGGGRTPVQIFATDLSARALQRARKGVYSARDLEHVSAARTERYFRQHGEHFRIDTALRESVTFAQHDLLHDAPFSRMDIVTCRNLLIYFRPEAHTRVLGHLHFALHRGGLLMTGRAESIDPHGERFEVLSKDAGLYRAFGGRSTDLHRLGDMPLGRGRPSARAGAEAAPTVPEPRPTQARIERFVLEQRTLACVVIDSEFRILHYYGPTERYLAPPSGAARADLPAWVRSGLFVQVNAVLRRAREQQERVSVEGRMERDGRTHQVRCSAEPVPGTGGRQGLLLVSFDDLSVAKPAAGADPEPDEGEEPLARQLERELRDARRELDLAIAQLQTSVEEYRANHEEMLSLNEELLSSNEELEAAKEELESLNEEMTTINQEGAAKNVQLESVNEDLRNLFASTGIPTLFLDVALKVRRFTPSIGQVMHLVEADRGRSVAHIKERYAGGRTPETARAVLEDGRSVTTELESDDGAWYRRTMAPYLSSAGKVHGVCVTFENVTAQKSALRVSDAARADAEAIVRTVRTPVLIVDTRGRVVTGNPALLQLSGLDEGALEGASLEALATEVGWRFRGIGDLVERVLRERRPLRDHELRVDDTSFMVNADLMAGGGDGERVLVALEDVSVHREFRQAALERAAELKSESLRKDEWIALLGHELRNPLGAVASAVALLATGIESEEERRRIVELMQRQVQQVDVLLDSLLDAARIVAGKLEIVREPLDLVELMRDVVEAHRLRQERRQSLKLLTPGPAVVIVRGDRARLVEVADNLLINASKYTPSGGEIRVVVDALDGRGRFSVRDDGVGITAEFMPQIFEMFAQGERGENTGLGLGLGLPLVKRLVELHEGEIAAHSDGPDRGSEFVVTLPLEEVSAIPVENASPEPRLRRILVVDDNVDATDILVRLLRRQGHEARAANDGPTTLAIATEFDPDVVLLDIGMPGMGGYEVATRLRAQPGRRHLIALTGYRRDEERLRAAGFDDHVSKPLSGSRLRRALADLDERQGGG